MCELAEKTPDGCFLELGVYQGGSAIWFYELAEKQGRALYLFDTFTGIPFRGPNDLFGEGAFSDANLPAQEAAMPNAKFYKGIFPQTLNDSVAGIAFMHIDCDQYQSCADALRLLWPRMVKGGVAAFDDYGLSSIRKAIDEYFPNQSPLFTKNQVPYFIKE